MTSGQDTVSFHIFPFGCQMNRCEGELLAAALAARGMVPSPGPGEADVILYMTCSVRQHAEDRVWSHLGSRRAAKERGRLRALGVLGCMAERLGEGVRRRMPHVDIVAGPGRIGEVPELVSRALAGEGAFVVTGRTPSADGLDPSRALRPRRFQAFLACLRGCDGACTYCVVPRVRGPETSVPPDRLEEAARALVRDGAVEITLLGQNIDRYGLKLRPATTLAALLDRLSRIEGLARLRFVTSHPRDVTTELLRVVRSRPNVMPYLHVPAQSGSDRVLAAMRRGHTRERYVEMLREVRRELSGAGIASDFIVGFPGETERDFEQTLSLVREAELQNAFIFKYSPRPGTKAARLPDDVPREVKEERHRVLSELQLATSLRLNRGLVGSEVEVLAEGRSARDPARWTGRTRTGRIAAFTSDEDPTGKLVRVAVEDATPLVLLGRACRATSARPTERTETGKA
jgi:tRNA-2-methylthio-N6-dimethylallyladenosine synthase